MRIVPQTVAVLALSLAAGCGRHPSKSSPTVDETGEIEAPVKNPASGDANPDLINPEWGASAAPTDGGTAEQQVAGTSPTTCPAAQFLSSLGSTRLLFGAQMADATASSASWDIRYLYLAGTISDGAGVCTACGSCTSNGTTCGNEGPGCGWWGCWQDAALAPGQYLRTFLAKAKAANQIPMISYYVWLDSGGVAEGPSELSTATNTSRMSRYLSDYRFALQQIGQARAFVHLEPDLWGYAQEVNADPKNIPASVASANPTDCANQPESFAGLGRCMVAMARKYAPNAKVGLQASGWASGTDAIFNRTSGLDVAQLGRGTANFLAESGGREADFVVLETSWDAGWYETQGINRWLDATNQTLPNFHQLFTWASAVTSTLGKPALFWQTPLGNMALPNQTKAWKDNRVDYFFDHPSELAAAGVLGAVFGSGGPGMTTPETDQGNLRNRFNAYLSAGGRAPCP